jgi:Uma2 family endonuclease
MSTTATAPKASVPEPPQATEPEQRLVLNGIDWRQYEKVLEAFPEQAGLRITYLDGRLTLLSPTRPHDWVERTLDHIVVAVAQGLGIEWEPAGHTTYRRERDEAGVEGDSTYYFGKHAEIMRGPREVDLTTQPPPDLAIEVEASHRADDSVAVWGRLGVPEVWRLDIKKWALTFGHRQDDGTYAPIPTSVALSPLEPGDVLNQLRIAEQLGSSRWYAQLDHWVRTVILPRRGQQPPGEPQP